MKTIQETVETIIKRTPFIEEAMQDKLINVSSLARLIQPEVEKSLGKEVKTGAVMMSINRMSPQEILKIRKNVKSLSLKLGDFIVRSDLFDYTFKNSNSLPINISKIFARIGNNRESFFTVSQGIFETNIVISANLKSEVDEIFAQEELINSMSKLASITIKLPKVNLEQSGIYYFILKQLAWANIPVQEVISTTHEITLVVKEEDINKTFSILIDLKKG
jgi:aspartokinase